ncbi:testin isoform X4 [Schistocerca serialis cubense]|uniref:testin isoform X4 n=1 Tax=Schistocerca serialis cubense TaxID=2023355 RepID=UPI00214F1D85|nr:testin isoform X4 [Schistocerca serialis cubense]
MSETSEKTPEWLVLLENKKKRHNRLAHEIGAGAPCLSCGDSCPGLDLHFWRKLCRNCKCKKEEHDVKDDEGYEQFEILLGPASKKRKRGACLNIKVPGVDNAKTVKSAEVAFDWVPPNVSDDVAVEYMKQLPTAKLPISGSDGALYRRQQLERQVPIHDLDASRCHNLTPQEVEGLKKYLDNLKSNVVGQGRVTKVPLLHADVRWASEAFGQKSLPASHSADSIRGIPPSAFSAPRPFHPAVPRMPAGTEDEDFPPPPPPLPNTMPPNLKKPSNFAPSWKPYHNPESQTSYSEALPGKPYTSSGFERAGPTDRLSQKNNSQQLASVGHQQFGTLPGECVSSLPADASVSHTLHPESHTAYSEVVPGKPSFASAEHHRSGSGVADPVSQRGQQQGDVGHQWYDVEHQHYGLMPENTAATLPADATFAHTMHPDSHTVYSESVPGKHSALSPEYHRTGLQGVHNLSPGKTVPTKHIPGESHDDAHRQQKGRFADTVGTGHDPFGMPEALPAKSSIYSSLGPHGETVFSEGVPTDALPKSALAMQQHRHDAELGELSSHMAEMKTDDTPAVQQPQFNCKECKGAIQAGDVAVFADRAGQDVAWHPSCFVCTTCKELLVDLIYFFNKGQVYCGRHYAELLKIPRCFACDELIFVNEYTMAEGQAFHVKHFCCYECDIPLGGMKYVPVDGQPVCLDCFQEKYGKSCHACGKKIGASDQRVSWNELHWHVSGDCFSCFSCHKSLLGGRFAVKKNQPFCSKECVLASGIL